MFWYLIDISKKALRTLVWFYLYTNSLLFDVTKYYVSALLDLPDVLVQADRYARGYVKRTLREVELETEEVQDAE